VQEQAEEDDKVEQRVHGLGLNTDETRHPEYIRLPLSVYVPWKELELEEVLDQNDSLENNNFTFLQE